MSALRRSISTQKARRTDAHSGSESKARKQRSSLEEDESLLQPSSQCFVIHGRTRYPSSQSPVPPEQLDLRIAQALLDKQQEDQQVDHSRRSGSRSEDRNQSCSEALESYDSNASGGPCGGLFDGPFDTRPSSRDFSGQPSSTLSSGALDYSSVSRFERSTFRDARYYATAYNRLASENGLRKLQTLSTSSNAEDNLERCLSTSKKGSKRASKNWLLTKLRRNASTKDLRHSNSRLSRRNSFSSLLSQRAKLPLRAQTLDDICRLGGVSVLDLPPKYRPVRLEMPTSLAATANYLVAHGRDTPGIFRIPGQTSITNALYDHYMFRIRDAENLGSIEATVGSLNLPTGLSPSVHDVASTFKKFLWDLPGGILGSMALFDALREICALQMTASDPTSLDGEANDTKASLTALAIISLSSNRQISLICAVFGLLAFLKRDQDTTNDASPTRYLGPESMGSKALGVVFAPILLGSLTDHVATEYCPLSFTADTSEPFTPKRGLLGHKKTPKHTSIADQSIEIANGFAKAKTCALIGEMLVRHWEEIVVAIFHSARSISSSFTAENEKHLATTILGAKSSMDQSQRPQEAPQRSRQMQDCFQTPRSGLAARRLRPLPYPPTPSLHFDPALHRSASIGVMPSAQNCGVHDNFRDLNISRKLARSNTALHLSNPADHSVAKYPIDRTPRIALPEKPIAAWWEDKATVNHPRVPLVTSNDPKRELEDRNLSNNDNICQKSPMTVSLEDSSDAGSIPRLDSTPPSVTGDEIFVEHLRDEGQNFEQTFSSNEDSIPHFTEPSRVIKSHVATKLLNVCNSEGLQDLAAKADNNTLRETFQHSPSMIPRPINEFGRSRNDTMAKTKTPPENCKITPRVHNQRTVRSTGSCSVKHLSSGRVASSRHSSPRFSSRMSHSTDRAAFTTRRPTNFSRRPGPQDHEPPVARRINFRPSPKDVSRRTPSSSKVFHQDSAVQSMHKPNVGTLFAEIRHLHDQITLKDEEIVQLKSHVDALKRFRDSGTLSEKLRESERDMRMWKCRAEWAEAELSQGERVGNSSIIRQSLK